MDNIFFANETETKTILLYENTTNDFNFPLIVIDDILNQLKVLQLNNKNRRFINIKQQKEIFESIKLKYNNKYNNYFTDITLNNFVIGLNLK